MKTIMRTKVFTKLALAGVLLFNLAACAGVDRNNGQPENRAFQEKPFSADEWIKGDAHARGEMALNLLTYETFKPLIGKSQSELLKVLGEPDIKTTGKCCYIRSGDEVEVWLYKIKSPGEGAARGNKTEDDAIQVFFNNDAKTVMALNRGEIDEKPAHLPMIG